MFDWVLNMPLVRKFIVNIQRIGNKKKELQYNPVNSDSQGTEKIGLT